MTAVDVEMGVTPRVGKFKFHLKFRPRAWTGDNKGVRCARLGRLPLRFSMASDVSVQSGPRLQLATAGDSVFVCCSRECGGFPVAILASQGCGESVACPLPLQHGALGWCVNPGGPHEQRFCSDPCARFVRPDHFNRADPKRGHNAGHRKRQPGR